MAFCRSLLQATIFILALSTIQICASQEVISHRSLVIDLGDGIKTDAELTAPVEGNGTFPGVLLIHGSGPTDMNEYLPPLVTGSNRPSRPFLQIAQYLSSRGFVVLRYNKRGVGLNGTVLNASTLNNATFQDLMDDAKKALAVLRAQPDVDRGDITILGHSEGTAIASRIAAEDRDVAKIVLMAAFAGSLKDILYFQLVTRPLDYAHSDLDSDHNGQLSISEVNAAGKRPGEEIAPLPSAGLVGKNNTTGEYLWHPQIRENGTGNISIQGELLPILVERFDLITTSEEVPGYRWLRSYFALNNTSEIIGNVSASILILNGENDTQVPVSNALLLEQRLVAERHPDHSLFIYPGLGHTFYPAEDWIQPLGPVGENVLSDIHTWLKSPERKVRYLHS
jgi:uncharacterized protein